MRVVRRRWPVVRSQHEAQPTLGFGHLRVYPLDLLKGRGKRVVMPVEPDDITATALDRRHHAAAAKPRQELPNYHLALTRPASPSDVERVREMHVDCGNEHLTSLLSNR